MYNFPLISTRNIWTKGDACNSWMDMYSLQFRKTRIKATNAAPEVMSTPPNEVACISYKIIVSLTPPTRPLIIIRIQKNQPLQLCINTSFYTMEGYHGQTAQPIPHVGLRENTTISKSEWTYFPIRCTQTKANLEKIKPSKLMKQVYVTSLCTKL